MITVLHNQSLLDLAVQYDGSVLSAFDWAVANGVSITDDLVAGQKVSPPSSSYKNSDVANFFAGKGQLIATAISLAEILATQVGIGTMSLENNFEIA
jgi:hypothetical protein